MSNSDKPATRKWTPAKYASFAGILIFVGFEFYFFRVHYHPIGYLGSAVPMLYGLWRIFTEKQRYQRIRIIVIVGTYVLFWFVCPTLVPICICW